jgi:hypothetical protein
MNVAGRSLSITFVNGRCISLEEEYDVTAMYTSSSTGYVVGSLDSVAEHGSDVPLAEASSGGCPLGLDSAAEARDWNACVRRSRRGAAPGEEALGSDEWFYAGAEQSLGVVRGRGRWILRRLYGHSGGAARGYFDSCDVAIPVPRAILDYAEQPAPWAAVRRRVHDASDAFVSPRRDFVVVLTAARRLLVFPLHGATLGAQLADVPAPAGSVVASEWATGSHVSDWTWQLAEIFASPLPRVAPR